MSTPSEPVSVEISVLDAPNVEITQTPPPEFTIGYTGPQGPRGVQGEPGEGFPSGGSTGNVLKKKSNTDFDTEWADDSKSLSSLTDVDLSVGPANGHALIYNTSTSRWVSGQVAETYEQALAGAFKNQVHRWRFNEQSGATVADSVGTLPLTLTGTFTRNVPGLTGTATTFGSAAKGNTSGMGNIPVGNSSRAFLVIYRTTVASNSPQALFSYGTTTTRQWFASIVSDGTTVGFSTNTWSDDLVWQGAPAHAPYWHLMCVGYDGSNNLYAYLDGTMLMRRTGAVLNTTPTVTNFQVGLSNSSAQPSQFFGDFDDLVVATTMPNKRQLDRIYRTLPDF